jgi:hypothetical protein
MLAGAPVSGATGIARAGTAARPNIMIADVSSAVRIAFPP